MYLHLFASAACVIPVASYVLATFGWRPSDIGLGTACAALAGVLASPGWGWLDDRTTWAPRAAVLGSAAAALATALTLGRLTHALTCVAMALFGAAAAPIDPLLTTRILESGVHGPQLGRLRAFGSLGWVLGLALAAVALTAWPAHPEVVLIVAGVLAMTAPHSWAGRRSSARHAVEPPADYLLRPVQRQLPKLPMLPILKVLVVTFPASFVFSALVQFTAGWARQELASGPVLALAPLALAAVLELPAFVWADRLANRFPPLTLVVLASPLLALATSALTVFPSNLVMIAGQPLIALGVALWVVGQSRMLLEAAPASRQASAQTLGVALSTGCAGLLAGAVGGHLADALGYRGLFEILAAASVLGTTTGLLGLARRRLTAWSVTSGSKQTELAR